MHATVTLTYGTAVTNLLTASAGAIGNPILTAAMNTASTVKAGRGLRTTYTLTGPAGDVHTALGELADLLTEAQEGATPSARVQYGKAVIHLVTARLATRGLCTTDGVTLAATT